MDKGTKLSPGLGLGLSIVQRILANLDHQLDIQSVEGHGSHFSIRVPLALPAQILANPPVAKNRPDSAAEDAIENQPDPSRPGPSNNKLAGLKILCIDNEVEILASMSQLLAGWTCEVKTALSLRDLVDAGIIEGWLPDIVLMDYHLDQVSGIDAIAWLRQNCGGHLPAVLVTADRSQSVQDQAKSNEIMMLHKPVKPAALRAILSRIA